VREAIGSAVPNPAEDAGASSMEAEGSGTRRRIRIVDRKRNTGLAMSVRLLVAPRDTLDQYNGCDYVARNRRN
jgi:hypothetical protein